MPPPDLCHTRRHAVAATDIGHFVASMCSPLTIEVHGEAIGIDGSRADMPYYCKGPVPGIVSAEPCGCGPPA